MSLRERYAFMFTDMRGFGAALETLPDETALEVLDAYEDVVRAQVTRHGGHIVNFVGDGAFVTFDRAADAVRCAVHVQRAQAWAIVAGRSPFPVAIGIHYGTASARRGDYVGDAVNHAARLQMRAHGWEILVSETACCAAGELPEITYEPLCEIAPGFAGTMRALAEGMPPPERAPAVEGQDLPTDREHLLELLFTLEDRLRECRREQTFLSVDVAGSTQLKAGEDPLAVEHAFRGYHRYVTRIIEEFGGRVQSTSGDGVLAAFERPEDAAHAAVELQTRLTGFNARQNRLRGVFRLRCGINTGEVALRESHDTAFLFSQVVDTAANLQERCVPGQIYVGADSAAGAARAVGPLREVSAMVDGRQVFAWPKCDPERATEGAGVNTRE